MTNELEARIEELAIKHLKENPDCMEIPFQDNDIKFAFKAGYIAGMERRKMPESSLRRILEDLYEISQPECISFEKLVEEMQNAGLVTK